MNQACTKKNTHTHIYCNGSLFSNMTIKNNNIKDNYKLNIPYILVLVIMSSSLKTRGEGKQQKRNFHEEEFQRLLLITATFCSAIGFHNFQNARSPFLPVGIHLERIIKNNKNEEERIVRLIFFEAKKKEKKKRKSPGRRRKSHTGAAGGCHFLRELKQENRKHVRDCGWHKTHILHAAH